MTESELSLFMLSTTVICAFMAVLNLARIKSRGTSAILLGIGFLVFGLMTYLYQAHTSLVIIRTLGVILLLVLLADLFIRSGNPAKRKSR